MGEKKKDIKTIIMLGVVLTELTFGYTTPDLLLVDELGGLKGFVVSNEKTCGFSFKGTVYEVTNPGVHALILEYGISKIGVSCNAKNNHKVCTLYIPVNHFII